MDAGASIVALVAFALSSTKTVYETISGIHDAPRVVDGAVRSLRQALHLLKSIGNANGQGLPAEFGPALQEYQMCLEGFNQKLKKLQPLPQDSRLRRAWRRFNTVLEEKDLHRLHQTTHEFTSVVSNYRQAKQLGIVESSHAMISQIRRSTEGGSIAADQITSQAHNHFISLNRAVESQSEMSNSRLLDIQAHMRNMAASGESQNHLVLSLLQTLEDKVQIIQAMSTQQSENLQSKLDQFHVQSRPLYTNDEEGRGNSGSQKDWEETRTTTRVQEEIDEALEILRSYAHVREQTIYYKEVEPIIDALDTFLKLICDNQVTEHASKKRAADQADIDQDIDKPSPKRLRRLISGVQHAVLTGKDNSKPHPITNKFQRLQVCHEVIHRRGTIRICVQAGRAKDDDNSLTEYKSKERIVEILKGTLYLLPCLANEIGISMSFSHKFYAQSGFSLAPVITFSRTLPEDSWVFTTIKGGDLVEFQRLLHTRGALLSDRDTSGRCLLNYALEAVQPNICEFLVSAGATVDFVEPDQSGELCSSTMLTYGNDCEVDGELLDRYLQCRQILMERGADPRLETKYAGSLWLSVLDGGTPESLTHVFYMGREFLDLNCEIWDSKQSPHILLSSCHWHAEMVVFLLGQGARASILGRTGNSALHFAIEGSDVATYEDIEHVLYLLLRGRANPYIRDNREVTVSHIVRDRKHVFRSISGFQSNKDLRLREIWISALRRAGYNAEEVMSNCTETQALLHRHCHHCSLLFSICSFTSDTKFWCGGCRRERYCGLFVYRALSGCEFRHGDPYGDSDKGSDGVGSKNHFENISTQEPEECLATEPAEAAVEGNQSGSEDDTVDHLRDESWIPSVAQEETLYSDLMPEWATLEEESRIWELK